MWAARALVPVVGCDERETESPSLSVPKPSSRHLRKDDAATHALLPLERFRLPPWLTLRASCFHACIVLPPLGTLRNVQQATPFLSGSLSRHAVLLLLRELCIPTLVAHVRYVRCALLRSHHPGHHSFHVCAQYRRAAMYLLHPRPRYRWLRQGG
jgi:hypothetical protein